MYKMLLLVGLTLAATVCGDWTDDHCTQVSAITGTLKHINKKSREVVLSTVINTHVALGETVCFKLEKLDSEITDDAYSEQPKSTMVYTLKLKDVTQEHQVLNGYDWVIPAAKVENHFCDCPCYADEGLSGKNYCSGKPQPCVQLYKTDQTENGCSGKAFCGDSTSDARVSWSLYRDTSTPIYTAFQIANPVTWLFLELNVYDLGSGKSIGEPVHINYSLQDGEIRHFNNRVNGSVSVAGTVSNIITPKYYFREAGSTDMYTGIELNTLTEWDLNKAGWFKWQNGQPHYPSVQNEQLLQRFSFHYSNCEDEGYSWNLDARYTYKEKISDAPKQLVQEQEQIRLSSISAGERQVTAKLRTSPRFTVYLEFAEVASVAFYYDESHLNDFEVKLQLDKYSNSFLNLSLQGAAGEILGLLQQPEPITFSLSVDSVEPINTVKYKGLPASVKCNETSKLMVCLNTRKQEPKCKPASVQCEKLTEFEVTDWDHTYVPAEKGGFWGSISKFFSHLNPFKWFAALYKNIKDLFGWLGLIGDLVIIALVIGLIIGVLCCLKRMGCCSFGCCKKEEKKEGFKLVPTSDRRV